MRNNQNSFPLFANSDLNEKQIGIMLDLDDTVFDLEVTDRVEPFTDMNKWISLLDEIIGEASSHDIRFRFCIVTSKSHSDDITEMAAYYFYKYLYIENTETLIPQPIHHQREFMHQQADCYFAFENNEHHCGLTSVCHNIDSADIKYDFSYHDFGRHCNFHINNQEPKTTVIKRLAAHWNMSHQSIVMIDDGSHNLEDAFQEGVPFINASCIKNSDDKKAAADKLLQEIKTTLFEKIKSIVDSLDSTAENSEGSAITCRA